MEVAVLVAVVGLVTVTVIVMARLFSSVHVLNLDIFAVGGDTVRLGAVGVAAVEESRHIGRVGRRRRLDEELCVARDTVPVVIWG